MVSITPSRWERQPCATIAHTAHAHLTNPGHPPCLLDHRRLVRIANRWITAVAASCRSAFPAPDPRDGEVLVANQVPRDPWRHDHTGVRCTRHVCQTYRHHPPESQRLP